MSIGINVTLYKCFENPFSIIFLFFELIQSVKTVLLSFEVMIISNTPSVEVETTILFFGCFRNIGLFLSKAIEINCLDVKLIVSVLKKLVNKSFLWVNKKGAL